jgi:hypothetical protein
MQWSPDLRLAIARAKGDLRAQRAEGTVEAATSVLSTLE